LNRPGFEVITNWSGWGGTLTENEEKSVDRDAGCLKKIKENSI
jgi:hypothetical protein